MTSARARAAAVWLGVRSLAWALLLPGVVAGYVPWRFFGLDRVHLDFDRPIQFPGLACMVLAASWALLLYWAIWFALANAFVVGYEEPALRRRFAASYDEYRQRVGRWLPKV